MTPTYSIVIPVYNVEKYLEICVDSVVAQSTSSCFEIILVNDGSADRSGEICDDLAEKLPCVKVIHQHNQGVSAARNAGIAAASGQYLLFLDGDDCWEPHLLQTLDQMIGQQPDLIEFGYRRFGDSGEQTPVLPAVEANNMTGVAFFESHQRLNTMPIGSSCTAAFRRNMVQEKKIQFPAGMTYGEDLSFHMKSLKCAGSVCSLRESLYRYRTNEASATHTLTVRKMRDILISCANMYHLFPSALFANYYCMKILNLEKLSGEDARQVRDLLLENRHILRHVTGMKMRIISILYQIFGYYTTAKLIRFCLN